MPGLGRCTGLPAPRVPPHHVPALPCSASLDFRAAIAVPFVPRHARARPRLLSLLGHTPPSQPSRPSREGAFCLTGPSHLNHFLQTSLAFNGPATAQLVPAGRHSAQQSNRLHSVHSDLPPPRYRGGGSLFPRAVFPLGCPPLLGVPLPTWSPMVPVRKSQGLLTPTSGNP